MSRVIFVLFVSLIQVSLFGQTLQLTQQKAPGDFKVTNGNYAIYFHKTDLINAIQQIDKSQKKDNSAISNGINAGTLTFVDINSKAASDLNLTKLLKSSLASFLLMRTKASVYKGDDQIKEIVYDESPPIVELDGSARNTIFFGEKNSNVPIFLGDLDVKLR